MTNKIIVLDSRALFCRKEISEFLSIDEQVDNFEIWTIEEVIQEIRDESTRQYLENLPYELLIKHPSPGAILHVRNFAKKTGDYLGLSETDIRVMSLAYQAIKLRGEAKYLNKEPPALTEFKPKWNKSKKIENKLESNDTKNDKDTQNFEQNEPQRVDRRSEDKSKDNKNTDQEIADDGWEFVKQSKKKIKNKKKKLNVKKDFYPEKFLRELKQDSTKDLNKNDSKIDSNEQKLDKPKVDAALPLEPDSALQTSKTKQDSSSINALTNQEPESTTNDESEDSCEDEWITPGNIDQFLTATHHINNIDRDLDDNSKKVSARVVTSDFSMQNVLMMLGIPTVSLDGVQINRIKRFKNL